MSSVVLDCRLDQRVTVVFKLLYHSNENIYVNRKKNLNILRISAIPACRFIYIYIYLSKKLNRRIYHKRENYSFLLKEDTVRLLINGKVLILFTASFAAYIVRQNT